MPTKLKTCRFKKVFQKFGIGEFVKVKLHILPLQSLGKKKLTLQVCNINNAIVMVNSIGIGTRNVVFSEITKYLKLYNAVHLFVFSCSKLF